MFRLLFRSKEEVVEPVIAEPPKQPLSNVPQVTAIPLGAYENLAKELEFCPAQLLEQQIKRFLIEQKIPTYNYEEVDRYLMHIVEKGGKVWIWRPLRERDKPKGWEIYGHDHNNSFDWWGHGSYRDSPKYRPTIRRSLCIFSVE